MEKSAGIILFRNKKNKRQYLVLKYSEYENYWGLCKGKLEVGESDKEAALRETKEETGLIEVKLKEGFKEKTNYYFVRKGEKIYKEVSWFLGKVLDDNDGEVSKEHTQLIWLCYEDAINRITHKKDSDIVRKCEEFLN